MTCLLEVSQLNKSFGARQVVSNLSFQVAAGEAFGLLGPNGAGKSTTMMMVAGVLASDSGRVELNGREMRLTDPSSRRELGVVPQELAIYGDLTARENLMFFGKLYRLSGQDLRDRVATALEQVGLTARANDLAETFSGGMKRRLNFAAAILHRPLLLILDEPTVGVDPQSRAHLLECVRSLQQSGTAVIYASHYMEEVESLCSRAAIVDHGKLLACDTIPELLKNIPFEVELQLGSKSVPEKLLNGSPTRVETTENGETVLHVATSAQMSESALHTEVSRVLKLLADHSIAVRSIRTLEPNLERLFLKLTGSRLRD
ncbi:MAG: ABC transporter ATP-binding protein [Planctomyces sp.]|nr:ABC transporter ATP-binding protein [Planctomyces sp.]